MPKCQMSLEPFGDFSSDQMWILMFLSPNPIGQEANKAVGGATEQEKDFPLIPIYPTPSSQVKHKIQWFSMK